jgi:hypothetical protein
VGKNVDSGSIDAPRYWNQRNHPNGHAFIASITMHSSMEASK